MMALCLNFSMTIMYIYIYTEYGQTKAWQLSYVIREAAVTLVALNKKDPNKDSIQSVLQTKSPDQQRCCIELAARQISSTAWRV